MLTADDMRWVEETVGKIDAKMAWVSEKSKEKIPYTTVNGVHDNKADKSAKADPGDGIDWWTNGFWGGMMWLMYQETGQEKYRDIARFSEEALDECLEQYYGLHHDVGFMWLLTAVADYRLTGNPDARRRGLHAASMLMARFNPTGKFLRAWNRSFGGGDDNTGWAIIDSMMNIPILYWASEELQDPRFKQVAMLHADTVMENFVRPDGSVRHIVEFDPQDGHFVQDFGGQGYGQGSSWTRGQSWGLYGFTLSYIRTGEQKYLDTAKRIAHYFISNIPPNGIIPVDFRQPAEPAWEDSTAAAIAACGLIEISKAVGELEKGLYLNAAVKLLKALTQKRCNWGEDCDCVVENGSSSYHNEEHHFSIIYGDYYLMEAMFKLKAMGQSYSGEISEKEEDVKLLW